MSRNSKEVSFADRPLCNAPTKSGHACQSRAMRNSSRCRSHGGATPAAIDAARVRAQRQADPLMAKLHALAFDDKMPPQVQLDAIKHAIKMTGAFEGKTAVEVTVSKRDFSDVTADVVMDLVMDDDDEDADNIIDAEVLDPDYEEDDNERWGREDAQQERAKEIERMRRGTPSPAPDDLNEQRAHQEAEAVRAHKAGELGDDDLSQPDRFGVRHDTSAQRAADRRNAEATRRADKTVRSSRSTSTADPYADRYPERTGGRRTISPKRYEDRKKERGGRPG